MSLWGGRRVPIYVLGRVTRHADEARRGRERCGSARAPRGAFQSGHEGGLRKTYDAMGRAAH